MFYDFAVIVRLNYSKTPAYTCSSIELQRPVRPIAIRGKTERREVYYVDQTRLDTENRLLIWCIN